MSTSRSLRHKKNKCFESIQFKLPVPSDQKCRELHNIYKNVPARVYIASITFNKTERDLLL